MSIRIPISLKFDETSDFYNDFVFDMRDRRTLSDFIVSVLKTYYENADIRDAIDNVLGVHDPLSLARQHIERAQLQHQKSVMSTSLLERQMDKTKTAVQQTDSDSTNTDIVQKRLETLEKSLPSMDEKMNQILLLIQSGTFNLNLATTVATEAPLLPMIEPKVDLVEPTENVDNTSYIMPTTEETYIKPATQEENNVPIILDTIIDTSSEPLKEEIKPIVLPPMISIGDDDSEEVVAPPEPTEPVRKKPSSFGKALKSIKS
jgi:hypothetical protein